MALFVRFWGTRGSIPTPGRMTHRFGGNTSCIEVRADETLFVLDGGTGMRELGIDLLARGDAPIVAHMLYSHMHWDHIQGFPFFLPAYQPKNRCIIYGAQQDDTRFHHLLSGQMRSAYFPVSFTELKANIVAQGMNNGELMIEGTRVRCIEQPHPGLSFAYSLEKGGRKVVYATDSELDTLLLDPGLPERDPKALRVLPQSLVDFMHGADLLVADGQYTDEEYPSHAGWGHPRATTVVDLAVQAQVKMLAIHHHDPMQTDADVDAKVESCQSRARRHGSELFVFGAREGLELKI